MGVSTTHPILSMWILNWHTLRLGYLWFTELPSQTLAILCLKNKWNNSHLLLPCTVQENDLWCGWKNHSKPWGVIYLEFNQSVKQANNIAKDKLHINRPIDSQKSKDEWCYNGNGKKQRKFSLSTHYSGSSCFENVRCSSVSCVVTQWKSILDWAHGSQMTLSSHARRVYSVLPYYINYHSFHPTETSQWADSG